LHRVDSCCRRATPPGCGGTFISTRPCRSSAAKRGLLRTRSYAGSRNGKKNTHIAPLVLAERSNAFRAAAESPLAKETLADVTSTNHGRGVLASIWRRRRFAVAVSPAFA